MEGFGKLSSETGKDYGCTGKSISYQKSKELDDNSQTKSDKKDALVIAKLVKDGRYFETYLPHDVYAELRGLTTTRISLNKRKKSIKTQSQQYWMSIFLN